jgi:hypothetical protein
LGLEISQRENKPVRTKQLIGAKKIMLWVCFTPIGIVDIVMLPTREMFDRSFSVHIVLDSLKKKVTQFPDPNPAKGDFLHLDNARPHLTDHEIQADNLTRLFHPAYSPDLAPIDCWPFEYLKIIPEESSFETTEGLQEKATGILVSIPASTFRAVLEE